MAANIFRILLLLISWTSLLFYPKRSMKRFFPVTAFVTILVFVLLFLSVPYKLWRVAGGIRSKIVNDLAFVFGPFFAVNLWVFHFSYGSLKKYFGINLIIDLILAFPTSYLFKKIKIYKLERLKPHYFFILIYGFSILAYSFQYFFIETNKGFKKTFHR